MAYGVSKINFDSEFKIEISLYLGCSVNCSYCPHTSLLKNSSKKRIDFDEFKILVDKIPQNIGFGFSGLSEPLLHEQFYSMAEYVHQKGHETIACSTMPEKYENNIHAFLNESLWSCRSLHLRDEFMSLKIDSAYLANIEKYFHQASREQTPKSMINYHTQNLDKNILTLLKKYNLLDRASYNAPYLRSNADVNLKQVKKETYKNSVIVCSKNHHKIQHLLPTGEVLLCCMDVTKKHVLGNLFYDDYLTIMNGEEYNRVLRGFNDEAQNTICRQCNFAKKVVEL